MPVAPPTFRHRNARTRQQATKDYDQRRGSARERGYGAHWDVTSRGYRRSHPLCLGCQAVGLVAASEVTDHVEPHKGDMVKFWDRAMWQPACRWHHDVVKQQLERMYGQGLATIDDLRLDSEKAKQLTLSLRDIGGGA